MTSPPGCPSGPAPPLPSLSRSAQLGRPTPGEWGGGGAELLCLCADSQPLAASLISNTRLPSPICCRLQLTLSAGLTCSILAVGTLHQDQDSKTEKTTQRLETIPTCLFTLGNSLCFPGSGGCDPNLLGRAETLLVGFQPQTVRDSGSLGLLLGDMESDRSWASFSVVQKRE